VVYQHNRRHVKLISRAASKLSDAQRERRETVDVAREVVNSDTWDPIHYLQPSAIARDVKRTADRLETAADDALATRQFTALANTSGALLRSHELRGRLSGAIADTTHVNVRVDVAALGNRVLDALSDSPDERERVAMSLLRGNGPSLPGVDLGLAQPPPAALAAPEPSPGPAPEKSGPDATMTPAAGELRPRRKT
jgi:hypothetical protein